MNFMTNQRGQSLIELLIAMAIFVLVSSAVLFVILDVYLTDRAARERTRAVFLAKEGMEAARSIRDNNWDDLTQGDHGLAIMGNRWVFLGSQEDLSAILRQGTRKVTVEEIDTDRKKITSQVSWQLTDVRPQQVLLVTFLTNWAKVAPSETCSSYCQSLGYSDGICRQNQLRCLMNGETYEPGGDQYCTGGPSEDTCCCAP